MVFSDENWYFVAPFLAKHISWWPLAEALNRGLGWTEQPETSNRWAAPKRWHKSLANRFGFQVKCWTCSRPGKHKKLLKMAIEIVSFP